MVLTDKQIKKGLTEGSIVIDPLFDGSLQPVSVDLHVGDKIWQVSGVPNLAFGFNAQKFTESYTLNHFNVDVVEPTLLPGSIYLVLIKNRIKLPADVWGYVNPKSSVGRIDLYCMLLAEGSTDFNVVPKGYEGQLYLLVIPQSFPVKSLVGQPLVQLRLYRGAREFLTREELANLHQSYKIIANKDLEPIINDEGLVLRLDLKSEPHDLVSVRGGKPISLSLFRKADPKFYFRVKPVDSNGNLFLEPGEFLLAASIEHVRIPANTCAEMIPYKQEHGDLRSHYAGFFDPGFGCGQNNEVDGASAVCEIRNIGNVPLFLSHGQAVATLRFESLPEKAEYAYGSQATRSNYQGQKGITLAKYFKPWS